MSKLQHASAKSRSARVATLACVVLFACAAQKPAPAATPASPPPASASTAVAASPPSASPAPAAEFDTSSPAAFTASVLARLKAFDPDGGWTMTEPLTLTGRGELVVSLDRVWHVCRVHADECNREAEHFVNVTHDIASQTPVKATASAFVPLIRDRAYLDSLNADAKAALIAEPLAADLVVVYAVDLGESVRSAQARDLTDAGVSRSDLAATARRNLAAKLPNPKDDADCKRGDVRLYATGNYFESSRLLLSDPWARLAASAKGPLLAAVPGADVVVVACNPDKQTLAKLEQAIDGMLRIAQRPVSRALLEWTAHGWTEFRR